MKLHLIHCTTVKRLSFVSRPPDVGLRSLASAITLKPSSSTSIIARVKRHHTNEDNSSPRIPPEVDERYRRNDFSSNHAWEARQAFLSAIAKGEAGIDLAEAALHIAAEDDALVTHSTVKFPVQSFQKRLQRMADELARVHLPSLLLLNDQNNNDKNQQQGDNTTNNNKSLEDQQLDMILSFIYTTQGAALQPPPLARGRTNLPPNTLQVDNPGVWENAKYGYLNEALVSKRGIPAILAIITSDILRRLICMGAIDFVVRIECDDMSAVPRGEVLRGMRREDIVDGTTGGMMLNFCSSDALEECLQYLKRAYWPFAWQVAPTVRKSGSVAGSSSSSANTIIIGTQRMTTMTDINGGFTSAARAFLQGGEDAELEAIARTARHRLERGIWTSPGAGDIRRAIAACERLVLLRPERPEYRRDLAVLLCHIGKLVEAKVELQEYDRLVVRKNKGEVRYVLSPTRGMMVVAAPDQSIAGDGGKGVGEYVGGYNTEMMELVDDLMRFLARIDLSNHGGKVEPLSVESALRQQPPQHNETKPLTW